MTVGVIQHVVLRRIVIMMAQIVTFVTENVLVHGVFLFKYKKKMAFINLNQICLEGRLLEHQMIIK